MKVIIGRIIALCFFAPLFLGAVYLGLNFMGNALIQLIPFAQHALETKTLEQWGSLTIFRFAHLFTIPASYKWLYYTVGAYAVYASLIRPLYDIWKLATNPPNSHVNPTQPRMPVFETDGERLDRVKRETELTITQLKLEEEALRAKAREDEIVRRAQQSALQASQAVAPVAPPQVAPQAPVQPQIQIVPVQMPMQFSVEQLKKLELLDKLSTSTLEGAQNRPQKAEYVKEGNNALEEDKAVEGAIKPLELVEPIIPPKEEVPEKPVEKVIIPAVSVVRLVEPPPVTPAKAFRRARNIKGEQQGLEGFSTPTNVHDKFKE